MSKPREYWINTYALDCYDTEAECKRNHSRCEDPDPRERTSSENIQVIEKSAFDKLKQELTDLREAYEGLKSQTRRTK